MDVDKWQQFHSGKWIGSRFIHRLVTGSTNEDAAAMSEELPHGAVIAADAQTAGRGRRGRTWESRPGENLYFSLLLKPDFAPDKASMLTLVMALAVAESIAEEVQIKWPNDIVIHGKKVCGILTEMQVEAGRIKHVVIGVGVNVHQRDFSGLEYASSLDVELGSEYMQCTFERSSSGCQQSVKQQPRQSLLANRETRAALLSAILTRFEQRYEQFCQAETLAPLQEAYQARLVNLGKEVQVLDPGGSFTGVALGIDERGQLMVQKADRSVAKVYAGEVSVRGLYGYV